MVYPCSLLVYLHAVHERTHEDMYTHTIPNIHAPTHAPTHAYIYQSTFDVHTHTLIRMYVDPQCAPYFSNTVFTHIPIVVYARTTCAARTHSSTSPIKYTHWTHSQPTHVLTYARAHKHMHARIFTLVHECVIISNSKLNNYDYDYYYLMLYYVILCNIMWYYVILCNIM